MCFNIISIAIVISFITITVVNIVVILLRSSNRVFLQSTASGSAMCSTTYKKIQKSFCVRSVSACCVATNFFFDTSKFFQTPSKEMLDPRLLCLYLWYCHTIPKFHNHRCMTASNKMNLEMLHECVVSYIYNY